MVCNLLTQICSLTDRNERASNGEVYALIMFNIVYTFFMVVLLFGDVHCCMLVTGECKRGAGYCYKIRPHSILYDTFTCVRCALHMHK